jgi:hypothetical protein
VDEDVEAGQLGLFLKLQARMVEALAAAVLLGIGVGVLAAVVSEALPTAVAVGVALLLSGVGAALVAMQLIRARNREHTIRGFFLYDPADAAVLPAGRRYRFAAAFAMYHSAACREVPELADRWAAGRENRLSGLPDLRLARDLAEYVILQDLVAHLTDHFGESLADFLHGTSRRRALEHIGIGEVPPPLRENVFLSLFSTPPAARPNFHPTDPEVPVSETAVLVYVVGGGMFERFELVLPAGSRVSRPRPETIEITTNRFTLSLTTACPGTVASLPPAYVDRYLRLGKRAPHVLAVDTWLIVRVRFRVNALLRRGGWSDYGWLDSWLAQARRHVSRADYLRRIGWDEVETALVVNDR